MWSAVGSMSDRDGAILKKGHQREELNGSVSMYGEKHTVDVSSRGPSPSMFSLLCLHFNDWLMDMSES